MLAAGVLGGLGRVETRVFPLAESLRWSRVRFARCLRCICGSVMWFVLAVWGEVPWLMVMSSTPRISVTTRLGPDASSFARSPRFHLPICRRRCVSVPEGGSQGTYFLCILVWFWYQLMLASNCVRGYPLPSPCKIGVLASLDV